jgi:hypothetical protein
MSLRNHYPAFHNACRLTAGVGDWTRMKTSPSPPVRHEDRKIQKLIERIKKQVPKPKVQGPDLNAPPLQTHC